MIRFTAQDIANCVTFGCETGFILLRMRAIMRPHSTFGACDGGKTCQMIGDGLRG